jgi:hypothetical protein
MNGNQADESIAKGIVLTVLFMVGLQSCGATQAPWQIGPFTRPETGNPVIAPRRNPLFTDPISKTPVHWEALHTFNPAAIVRDGKICCALPRGG